MIPANTVKQSPAFLWFSPSELARMLKRLDVPLSTCAASSASPFRVNRGVYPRISFCCLSMVSNPFVYLISAAIIFAASRFAFGSALAYMLSVIAAFACPMMLDTVLISIPPATAIVAHVWRKSWNVGKRPSVPLIPNSFARECHSLVSRVGLNHFAESFL